MLVLQQQKKIAEELNRVIKAMNNGGKQFPNSPENGHTMSQCTFTMEQDVNKSMDDPENKQISIKNMMINPLNSAGSDIEDSVTGDSTSDLHTERLVEDVTYSIL